MSVEARLQELGIPGAAYGGFPQVPGQLPFIVGVL